MARVAKALEICESRLRRRLERDAVDGGRAEGPTSAEREKLVEPRPHDRVLEIEILKRASTYSARANILRKQSSGWSRNLRGRVRHHLNVTGPVYRNHPAPRRHQVEPLLRGQGRAHSQVRRLLDR